LETLRSTHRPDAALNAALLIALASSHDAAAAASGTPSASAAEIVADQDADVVDTLKKGGKGAKGKGGAAKKAVVAAASVTTTKAAPASFDPKDPHGVQLALAPASHLRLQPEHLLLLHTARSRVRRYSTALQLLRFLGVFSLREGVGFGARDSSSATLDKDGGPTPTALAAAAALVAEATDAWQAGLPLHATAAAAGSDREAGDCDELILLEPPWFRTVLRITINSRSKLYTNVGYRNAPIERITIIVVIVSRNILIEFVAYFLNFIQKFGNLVSFRYNLPEPCACRVPPFRLIFVHSRSGEEFHSGNMESGRVFGTKPGPE